jgi:N-acetylmuramoyl-L-alanine amidase
LEQPEYTGDGEGDSHGDEMTFSLLWLPQVLRAWGLTVQAVDGWERRGHGDMGKPLGTIAHHTCGPKDGDIRDLHVLVDGRPDLAGPLCNLGLARSGVYWLVAAGKAWHAGAGSWQGITDGNSHFIGIEAENVGDGHDPWPTAQMDAYKRGCAAILTHIGAKPSMCIGHKEWAPHRKDDPTFSMPEFRNEVAMLMSKTAIPTS